MASGLTKQDLLYVSVGGYANSVDVFTYPQGESVGVLTTPSESQGLCADQKGNVYVTSFFNTSSYAEGDIFVYAHGGSNPARVLHDGTARPMGCSVDPGTGNLAVTNYCSITSCKNGNVAIFAQAKGTPKEYKDSTFVYYFYCGYDDKGNLFVDGYGNRYGEFRFAELPKGGTKFTNVSLTAKITEPGGVQWDGKNMTVGDQKGHVYRIAGTSGKVVGTTTLRGSGKNASVGIAQYWIEGTTLVGPGTIVGFWHYPQGGSPYKVFGRDFGGVGAAVSVAQ